jgi:Tol biopolymer transport system component
MKQGSTRLFIFVLFFLSCTVSVRAQYWGVWQKTHNITLGLSQDEKWVFFLQKNEAGITNIYRIELKTNAVTPVTNFTDRPVLSGIVLFGKLPAVVYARAASAKGDDIHLYRINIMTTDPPVDFTPKDATSSKQIIGLAYNGRYVYYYSDKGPGSHKDTYRYDTQQYIIEQAFPNDKDYETLCWDREQTHLLLRDPRTLDVYNYNIETTDRQKIDLPFVGNELKTAFYDPMNTSFYLINKGNQLARSKITAGGTSDVEMVASWSGINMAELSLNGKYMHVIIEKSEKIMDMTTNGYLELPGGSFDFIISPKETSVLFVNKDAGKDKLYLYDIAKKTSKELTTIK